MTDILVFVPGGLGSELWDGNEKIWPPKNVLLGYNEEGFQRLLKQELNPKDIFRRVGLIPIYADWLSVFENIKKDGQPLFAEADGTIRCVPYDWRKSVADAAQRLGEVIHDVLRARPQASIHIVAHSLGGVVSRYFLRASPPPSQIKSLITLGTPHQGAPIAVATALGIRGIKLLTKEQTKRLANHDGFPALYEIFPNPDLPVFWRSEKITPESLYKKSVAAELGLNIDHLQKARKLHRIIKGRLDLRVLQLAGTQFSTITHLLWRGGKEVEPIESADSGDGAVPVASALHDAQICFTAREHMKLMLAAEAKDALAAYFGAEIDRFELATATAGNVEVATKDFAIDTETPMEAVVSTMEGALRSGVLSFEQMGDGVALIAGQDFPIEAPGARQRVSMKLKHNLPPGMFRPVFTETATGAVNKGDAFIVMDRGPHSRMYGARAKAT